SIFDWFTLDVTDLLRAIEQNDPGEVERALSARVNPNKRDGIRRLALPIAVNNNNTTIVKMLLDANANPNALGADGESPLYKAVFWDNKEICQLLLSAGANPDFPNLDGTTPKEEAIKNGYTSIAQLLKKNTRIKKANQIAEERKKHKALKARAAAERKKRIERAQKQKEKEERKKLAEEQKNKNKLERQYGVKKDGYLKGLLRAMTKKDSKATKIFSEKIANINAYDEAFKTTPLLMSVNHQNMKLATFLMEKGADPLFQSKEMQHSALTKAINLGMYEFVEYVINNTEKEKLKAVLNDPQSIMSPQLLCYKDARMFDLLLRAGADAYFGGKDMPPPIVKAIEKASLGILPVLERNKVDLNRLIQGRTLLGWAIYFKRIDWVNGLIEEGAEVDAIDNNGKTALMYAVEENLPEVVNLLLEADADPKIKNNNNQTALQLAKKIGDRAEVIRALKGE
ncbi:MAG TPA: hypothetical protein ENJ53_10835, partial [Phaeodactylibacter sp.]|nr:hypothetical protein [Phaeodactylibacter sp.]